MRRAFSWVTGTQTNAYQRQALPGKAMILEVMNAILATAQRSLKISGLFEASLRNC